MNRINEIHAQMMADVAADPNLRDWLNSTSRVAIYRLLLFVVATAIYVFEQILQAHNTEIESLITTQKVGKKQWYHSLALNFLFGYNLIPESDNFDTTGASADDIDAAKVIKYASVDEVKAQNKVLIKVATELDGQPQALTQDQSAAFEAYIQEVKFAGVRVQIVNLPGDLLSFSLKVFRDAKIIDEAGINFLSGENEIEVAVANFFKSLDFDGRFVINDLIAFIRRVDGVKNAEVLNVTQSRYDIISNGYESETPVETVTIPRAGYFKTSNISYQYVV